MEFDLLVRGGTVHDGSGAPGRRADLGIRGDRIALVGEAPAGARARRTIDAGGLVVAPGFIDVKTHSDFTLPINPRAESKVRQGVTTEVIGHCGFSVAPVLPGKVDLLRDYLSPSAPWLPFRETTFPDYHRTFPATSVNVGMLVGHNTLRLMAMGMENRPPTADEQALMERLADEALAAGALGLSTGLFTSPGSYAGRDELIGLGRVVKRHGAGYFTHLRDESNRVFEAVAEAIDLGETCGVHVQIVHLKLSGTDMWGRADEMLALIEAARRRGVAIDVDEYPYTAGSNPLKNLLPQWVQAGGVPAMLERLRLPETRERVRADIARDGLNNWGRIPSWDNVRVSISPNLPQFAGKTFGELARERGQDPIDTVCDYLADDKGATRVLVTSISEDDVRTFVRSPMVCVGSDGNCVAKTGITSQGMPHPRFYGTFPRVLGRYVRDEALLPLETAIHKMTGVTATALGLVDRGWLREELRADVTIFDPATFDERATYADPHQYPASDATTVIVNGVIVVDRAEHTGAVPGKVLVGGTDTRRR